MDVSDVKVTDEDAFLSRTHLISSHLVPCSVYLEDRSMNFMVEPLETVGLPMKSCSWVER